MTIQLHCFGESGHSYKVALALTLLGEDWEPVFVDFFKGAARSPEFRSNLNPMGECPVFIDGDLHLTQSGVILDYLVQKHGKLGGTNAVEKREVLRWVLWDNHKGSSQFGMTRFLMNFLPEEKRPQDVIGFMQGRVRAALAVLDAALEGREWLAADHMTIADISCCSYLFYPEAFGFDRAEWPNIDAWLGRIENLPGWKHPYDLMPGSPADRA